MPLIYVKTVAILYAAHYTLFATKSALCTLLAIIILSHINDAAGKQNNAESSKCGDETPRAHPPGRQLTPVIHLWRARNFTPFRRDDELKEAGDKEQKQGTSAKPCHFRQTRPNDRQHLSRAVKSLSLFAIPSSHSSAYLFANRYFGDRCRFSTPPIKRRD